MSCITYVKQILIMTMFLFQTETFAQSKCENLFQSQNSPQIKAGSQILHEKDQQLHMSKLVQKAVTKHKEQTGISLTKPNEKLNQWLNYLTKISAKAESSPRSLEQVKTILNNQFIIKETDVPESYYALQVKIAKERGHGDITLTNDQKKQLADTAITDQKKSLESWTEYLVSKDTNMYPMWIKYWMFTGMTKLSKYNATNGQFGNRDKSTVAPFAELNREALGLVVDHVLKYTNKKSLEDINDPELVQLLSGLNFGKLYSHVLFKLGVGKEGAFKTNQGQWVIYKQGSDHTSLVKSLEGRNTGWCTAGESTAESQLKNGDFHVYYSLDENGQATIPRVAVRMEGDEIAEVRGVAANQNLDPQINQSTVVSSKMKDFGSKAEKFQKKDHDMKMLTQIETKHISKIQLSKEDISFLYEFNEEIHGFGYNKDPRIYKIKSERDMKSDVIFAYDNKYTREEITSTLEEFNLGKSRLHIGNLNLTNLISAQGLKLPDVLNGGLYLGSLKSTKGLQLPNVINGLLDLSSLTSAHGLKLPDIISGALYLGKLMSSDGLVIPDTFKSYLDLNSLTSAQGLKLPNTINGGLHLFSLKSAQGLKLPDTFNIGILNLSGLTSAQGLKLPSTFNGYLKLLGLTTTQGLKLPDIFNGDIDLSGLDSEKGLILPKGVRNYFGPRGIQR